MISKDGIQRGFNRGNYVVGAHTPPYFANEDSVAGESSMQVDVVDIPENVLGKIRDLGIDVTTDEKDVINGTRDWWARTMIAETSGNPATPKGAIVTVDTAEHVQQVVKIAAEHRIPVTASAGRSNVIGGAWPVKGGIVLDVCRLNKIVSYDEESQIVEVEAGMFGDVFEAEIQEKYKVTAGNWPSSYGISTVGGWVACRGAGQLSTRYGKIEDMVFGLDVVLPNGELITVGDFTRAAVGPDLKQLFIGSEGTLGIITKIRLKAHRLPEYAAAFAYGFDTFADGLDACRELMQRGTTPAALRLYDKLESGIHFGLKDTNILLVADEGEQSLIDPGLSIAEEVCAVKGTKLDGDDIFEQWLETRFLTGKSSDGFERPAGFVADTLEMEGRWSDLSAIYDEVVEAVMAVPGTVACSAHQSHAYVDAACLYFSLRGDVDVDKRAEWYVSAWDAANEVIIRHGASLSHHHGVGLVRSRFMKPSLGASFEILRGIKHLLDPDNLFNPGKLGLDPRTF